MTQVLEPDFDLFELTHINEVTRLREVNDDVKGELRQKVIAYLDEIQNPAGFEPIEIDPSDLEGDDDDA